MIDFLVIGGGIAGVSAAARLSELGSVHLVEGEDGLAYHASGRSAAMYLQSYGNHVIRALNTASLEHLLTCAGGDGVLSDRGVVTLATREQAGLIDTACEPEDTIEIGVSEARELCPIINPDSVARAAYTGEARDLDTDLLLQDFAKKARNNGAVFQTRASVSSIKRETDGWVVGLTLGKRSPGPEMIKARTIVNAAGAWADQIAELAGVRPVGLTPLRRSMARMPGPGGQDVTKWPMMLGAAEDWYAKPDAGKWLVSPSEQDPQPPHDAFADDMVLAEGIARYEAMVTQPVTRVETTWAGLRTFAPDRALVLGPDNGDSAFIWCAGQGGYGFQTAAGASATLGAIIGGTQPPVSREIIRSLSVERFGDRS